MGQAFILTQGGLCRVICFSHALQLHREGLKCASSVACSSVQRLPAEIYRGSVRLLLQTNISGRQECRHNSTDARQACDERQIQLAQTGKET